MGAFGHDPTQLRVVPGMDPTWNTVAVAGNRIILEHGAMSTNIWIK